MSVRRNARDFDTLPQRSKAMLTLAAVTVMTHRLTRRHVYPASAPTRGALPHGPGPARTEPREA
ncbi:hypothetical protein [Streptomyces venezuelae]|uniref:hypothetical protein n=1 Tax=Streptomyces venezuelae TaxID=54571 RepID=UPI00378B1DF0